MLTDRLSRVIDHDKTQNISHLTSVGHNLLGMYILNEYTVVTRNTQNNY